MGFRHCTDNVTTAFTGHDIHDGATGAEKKVVLHQRVPSFGALYLLHNTEWLCHDVQLIAIHAHKQCTLSSHHTVGHQVRQVC